MQQNQSLRPGLYIHIPFCRKKCRYCDFYSITDLSLIPSFLKALATEIRLQSDMGFPAFDSIYFGGGTPSVISPTGIHQILEACRSKFDLLADAEITLEINPKTVNKKSLLEYRQAGVTRVNIGVQSFNDHHLAFLGRLHDQHDAADAIRWARHAGYDSLGLDLIYGIPGQTIESWLSDLERGVEFMPDHLSCYLLTYEPGTLLHADLREKKIRKMPEKQAARLFLKTDSHLEKRGFEHYEISNFAGKKNEFAPFVRSRHNQKYWNFAHYIGLGPAAHSFNGYERSWNCRSLEEYIRQLSLEKRPLAGKETLSRDQQALEAIYLGLRKREGISVESFEKMTGIPFFSTFSEAIPPLLKQKMIQVTTESCALTTDGMLFHESICQRIADCVPPL
ncbi:MAG: radical SAM family heme chaperone HemW [Pseudomonadota bacterium]